MQATQNPPLYIINSSLPALPLWQAIGETVAAWRVAARDAESPRAAYLLERLEGMTRDFLPTGSGFGAGAQFNPGKSRGAVVQFDTAFHHLNESGFYDGWTKHTVTLRPSLSGFPELKVTGRDKNGIREYIGDVFCAALQAPVLRVVGTPGDAESVHFSPVETVSEYDALDACAALWESVLELARLEEVESRRSTPARALRPVSETLESHGYGATRDAITGLAPAAHIAWTIARREEFDAPFDWEFCPAFAARAILWSLDGENLPTLHPHWRDVARAIGRGMTA